MSLALATGVIVEEKLRAALHFLSIHVENLRAQTSLAAASMFHIHQLRVAFAGSVVVTADRANIKAFLDQVTETNEHFHEVNFYFIRQKSILNTHTIINY